ncbi:hypothetical protein CC2G_002867 [Coprinopsis cinerea AmutBmut pab1-1]|nr:hypothetical protein CC2G_002867 [Coprinopsis cinerea AmutBmut pab1-1]
MSPCGSGVELLAKIHTENILGSVFSPRLYLPRPARSRLSGRPSANQFKMLLYDARSDILPAALHFGSRLLGDFGFILAEPSLKHNVPDDTLIGTLQTQPHVMSRYVCVLGFIGALFVPSDRGQFSLPQASLFRNVQDHPIIMA